MSGPEGRIRLVWLGVGSHILLAMLPSERRLRDETASREAAGESLWTHEFDLPVRVRLSELWRITATSVSSKHGKSLGSQVGRLLRARVGREVDGIDYQDLRRELGTDLMIDVLAAGAEALTIFGLQGVAEDYQKTVNMVLNQHRVAYKFVEGELVSFESDQLMQEVVEPSLRLLVGDKFKAAHHAYMDALKEISNGKPDDAITDAGRALQQTLMALGCEGDVLSQLIADAKSKDLFRSHDQQLHEALILVMRWAASERNKLGDAHEGGDSALADAWLIVHVVGALIVRLADPKKRGA